MAGIDNSYHKLSELILEYGYWYNNTSRDVRCKQLSDAKLDIPITQEFPLLTTKKMFTKGIVAELIWFLRGDDNIKYLLNNGVNIWNKDAYNWYKRLCDKQNILPVNFEQWLTSVKKDEIWEDNMPEFYELGDVGRNYGVQWREFTTTNYFYGDIVEPTDQITDLIKNLVGNPMSRRHIVTAWNPAEINKTALPPCHWSFEIIPRPLYDFEKKERYGDDKEYGFTLKWHQRSVDTFLGLPFNIASYALLAEVIAELTGFVALNIVGDLSNVHFYEPHIEGVKQQLERRTNKYVGCKFTFNDETKKMFEKFRNRPDNLNLIFESLEVEDFIFEDYQSYDRLPAEMFAEKN